MKNTIIVVGAGAAGLSAAITAAELEYKVILVSSMASERAQSVMAMGGINAALNTKGEDDSLEEHYKDTMKASVNLANPEAVSGLVKEAPTIVKHLSDIGVQFNRDESGQIDLRNFGGQKKKRTAFASSGTGKQIITGLVQEARKYESKGLIKRYMNHSFVTYIGGDLNECIGCILLDNSTEELVAVNGCAVILATGGMNGVFGKTTGSVLNTGYVTAEVFRRGVSLANSEFIQYHPTTFELSNKRMLISESARGEGGRLFTYKDGKPWYFMEELYPEMGALMPRDIVSKEIYRVCNELGILIDGEKKVYLDLTHISKDIFERKLTDVVDQCKTYSNIDPQKEYIPVYPGIHYFMGGIYVNELHQTTLKNLYAVGECSCQYHGANRLGGNSLLGAIYGGMIAAKTVANSEDPIYSIERIRQLNECEITKVKEQMEFISKNKNSFSIPQIKYELNQIMNDSLGIVRDQENMEKGINALDKLLHGKIESNYDRTSSKYENYMIRKIIILGKAILTCALSRRESRGAHIRRDFPTSNDELYLKTTIVDYDGEKIIVSYKNICQTRSIE